MRPVRAGTPFHPSHRQDEWHLSHKATSRKGLRERLRQTLYTWHAVVSSGGSGAELSPRLPLRRMHQHSTTQKDDHAPPDSLKTSQARRASGWTTACCRALPKLTTKNAHGTSADVSITSRLRLINGSSHACSTRLRLELTMHWKA